MNTTQHQKDQACKFVLQLAELMSDYGASVQKIEDMMFTLNDFLELNGNFVLFNRILLTSFDTDSQYNQVHLKRFGASRVNLLRLEMAEKLFIQITQQKLSIADGLRQLESIRNSPRLYNPLLDFLSWPLLATGFVLILSGNLRDLLCAGIISTVIYFANKVLSHHDNGTGLRISVPICSFIAAFLAVICKLLITDTSSAIIVTSSLMKFMPGLYLTQAMTEIAYRRLTSGIAHLSEAIFILVVLALGVFLGTALGNFFIPVSLDITSHAQPFWQLCLAGILVGSSFIFSFDIIRKHIPIVIATSIIVTLIWIWSKEIYGPVYGTGIAALTGAFMANIYTRITCSSDLILKLPSAIIIVPGIFAFRALIDILNNNTVTGLEHFLTTFMLGAAIAGGFLIIDIIIPPEFSRKNS